MLVISRAVLGGGLGLRCARTQAHPPPTPLGALGAGAHFLLSPPRHVPLVPAKAGPSRRTSTPGSPEAEPAAAEPSSDGRVSPPGASTLFTLWLGRPFTVFLVIQVALRKTGETEKSRLSYDWFNFFFSAGEKRIKLQDSFNIFTMLKLKLGSRLCV